MTEQTTAPLILPKPSLYHIIIVGGGAGGLELATTLGNKLGRRKKAAITLVDRSRTHIWKPLLHEIAAGSMDIDRHEVEYMAQGHWHGFQFRYGEMIGLDRANKRVHLAATLDEDGKVITPDRWLPYDTLIIAIGSVTNDFGVPGASQYAMSLDTPEQAARFNRRLINACVRANTQHEPIRPSQLDVAIIGAGATGTELSAELHGTARGVVAFGLDKIDPDKDIKISLIEAADRIVPALPPRISEATTEILQEAQRRHSHERARHGGDGRGREARERQLHSLGAGRVGRGREGTGGASRTSMGSRSADRTRSSSNRHCRRRSIPTSSHSAIAPTSYRKARLRPFRRARRLRISRRHIS